MRLWIEDGELVADPATVPTFFLGYLGDEPPDRRAPWRTGDRVIQDDDGYLFFEGRTDDVIISAGYRIGPFEVESALVAHPAVAEAAVVAAPDEERGAVVRAVVVLRDGHAPCDDARRASCRTTSRRRPRPTSTRASSSSPTSCRRPPSGKVRRALLRDGALLTPQLGRGQVGGQRDLLRRRALGRGPSRWNASPSRPACSPSPPSASSTTPAGPAVGQAGTDVGRHAHELAHAQVGSPRPRPPG